MNHIISLWCRIILQYYTYIMECSKSTQNIYSMVNSYIMQIKECPNEKHISITIYCHLFFYE